MHNIARMPIFSVQEALQFILCVAKAL